MNKRMTELQKKVDDAINVQMTIKNYDKSEDRAKKLDENADLINNLLLGESNLKGVHIMFSEEDMGGISWHYEHKDHPGVPLIIDWRNEKWFLNKGMHIGYDPNGHIYTAKDMDWYDNLTDAILKGHFGMDYDKKSGIRYLCYIYDMMKDLGDENTEPEKGLSGEELFFIETMCQNYFYYVPGDDICDYKIADDGKELKVHLARIFDCKTS